MNRPWVAACAAAEAIGMTAAAGAAHSASTLTDRGVAHATALGLLLVVLGGLVEGTALGWFQGRALAGVLGPSGRRHWLLVTVLVAGIGWAAASAPGALADGSGGDQPPVVVVILGAAALGAVMGALLGGAQVSALLHRVRHPWRWAVGSIAGWTAAMPVIFLGATSVGAAWPGWLVVLVGTLTGGAAGAVLGASTGPFVDSLDRPSRDEGPARPGPLAVGRPTASP